MTWIRSLRRSSFNVWMTASLLLVSGVMLHSDEIGSLKIGPPTPAGLEYNKGVGAITAGNLAEAESHFKKSLQLEPKNPQPYVGLAKIAIDKGDPKGAMVPLRKAASLAPDDVSIQSTWGHYLFWQQHYAESKAVLEKAIKLDPQAVRPRVELGDLYLVGLHQPNAAIESYRAALKLQPNDLRVVVSLAKALGENGQLDQAEGELQQAILLDPKEPALFQSLGDLRLRRHDLDGALESYAAALKIQSGFVPAHISRGDIFLVKGNLDKAMNEYAAASKADPKSALVYIKMGGVYEREHKPQEAQQAYKTAIALDSKQAVPYNNLAWMACQEDANLDGALAWATKAVELAPKVATFRDTLGWVYQTRGQYDLATVALKKALRLAPNDPEILYHLGVVYSKTKQPAAAREALEKALAQKKDFPEAGDARSRLQELSATR